MLRDAIEMTYQPPAGLSPSRTEGEPCPQLRPRAVPWRSGRTGRGPRQRHPATSSSAFRRLRAEKGRFATELRPSLLQAVQAASSLRQVCCQALETATVLQNYSTSLTPWYFEEANDSAYMNALREQPRKWKHLSKFNSRPISHRKKRTPTCCQDQSRSSEGTCSTMVHRPGTGDGGQHCPGH